MARAELKSLSTALVLGAFSFAGPGCGPGRASSPDDRVFYQNGDAISGPSARPFEWAYPPLDAPASPELPSYDGVSLFEGAMRLSRPHTWIVRLTGGPVGGRYIQYASPHAYLFSVYELAESVSSWNDVLGEYESTASRAGAEFLSKRVPMATANGQGFAYVLRRTVTGAKGPLVNYAHEYLIRGDHRVLLAQVVHHTPEIDGVGSELRRVLETVEIP